MSYIHPYECTTDQLWQVLTHYKFDYCVSQLRREILAELVKRIMKEKSKAQIDLAAVEKNQHDKCKK